MVDGIPHSWQLSFAEAKALQSQLAAQVDTTTPLDLANLRYVAGVDVSVKNDISRAAIVVLTYPDLTLVEAVTERQPTTFPYVSGYLTFREGEVILRAHEKLQHTPDMYIFDGAGIAHPRRIGIAAHLGLWWNRPTIGCAKKRLIGEFAPLPEPAGSFSDIVDKGEIIGRVIRTRDGVKPVYVSVGHHATLETAAQLIFRTTTRYRLPEPIRYAHQTAGKFEED